MKDTNKKPVTVKFTLAIVKVRMIVALLAIAILISAIFSNSDSGFMYGFLEAAGTNPATYSAEDAGRLSSPFFWVFVFDVLFLVLLKKRKLLGLRVLTVVLLIFMLPHVRPSLIQLAVTFAVFTRSFRDSVRKA